MRAGKLRHRVQIQRSVNKQDPETGAVQPIWEDVSPCWASFEALSAREFIAASAVQSEITGKFVIRHRDGLDAAMRIVHRNRAYNIHGLLPDLRSGTEYITVPVSIMANAVDTDSYGYLLDLSMNRNWPER